MAADTGREAPPDAIAFYRRAGWGDAAIESYRVRFGNFGKHIHALPESYHRLSDGDDLRIGGTPGASSSAAAIRPNMPACTAPS
jgi:hypothetical protein